MLNLGITQAPGVWTRAVAAMQEQRQYVRGTSEFLAVPRVPKTFAEAIARLTHNVSCLFFLFFFVFFVGYCCCIHA